MVKRIEADNLFELTAELVSASSKLHKFLDQKNLPQPSFDAPAPSVALNSANKPYYDARSAIVEAAEQLIRLVRGPRDTLLALSFEHCATASMQVVFKYKFANHIPLHGSTTYSKIAEAVGDGVTTALVERTIQHCASFGLFETIPGAMLLQCYLVLLVTDPDLEAWMYLSAVIAYPAGAAIPKAVEQYGVSHEADESGYGASIGRKIAQFQRFREPDGKKDHEMFARAMRGIAAGGAYDFRHAVDGGYPWHLLAEGAGHLVVDVGGGPGHVAMALAEKYPSLRFQVQDLPETVQVGAKNCPEHLKSRVSFQSHDFFTSQPAHEVQDGEGIVYFARFILHDWSDKYATKIVQQLATGLRPQDRIILNEVVVPEAGQVGRETERRMHDRDLLMLMNLNGRERTQSAFEAIFASVTPKLRLQRVIHPEQGELSLIEVTLDGVELPAQANGVNGHANGTNGVNGH
uniref:O-methyltransferase CTB2 n=1 Tax=Cercospora nicotianae TaxID=29003 RepID=CTB2_CERNC|nr:RecName: Full=O-methyltransferase CTB2; AltName: Full=Cercosporin toxin biosynthesis cluster protein 2 [Cercospora nicotianae]ABK64180.1 O-methyltransferase [Cercospora nicotianae]